MYSKIACGLALAVGMANGAAHNLVRRDGAHGHAAESSYSEPAASSYGAPATAPATGYGAPADDLGSYEPAYGATGYGEPETPFDISTLIIPLLIIFGLSLLFPTSTTVDVNAAERRRRSLEGDHQTDVIERVNEIYTAVVQSEECMEKIACEVGALAGDVGLTQSPALKIAGGFVPSKYKTYYKQFTAGKDCHKIKCGTFA